ncbi:unnamed protein product, partial [Caretta caretta]
PTRSDPGHRPDLGTPKAKASRHTDRPPRPRPPHCPASRHTDLPPAPPERPPSAGVLSEYLQEAVPLIIPHEQCRSPGLHGARVTADMLCASYLQGGTNACQ